MVGTNFNWNKKWRERYSVRINRNIPKKRGIPLNFPTKRRSILPYNWRDGHQFSYFGQRSYGNHMPLCDGTHSCNFISCSKWTTYKETIWFEGGDYKNSLIALTLQLWKNFPTSQHGLCLSTWCPYSILQWQMQRLCMPHVPHREMLWQS